MSSRKLLIANFKIHYNYIRKKCVLRLLTVRVFCYSNRILIFLVVDFTKFIALRFSYKSNRDFLGETIRKLRFMLRTKSIPQNPRSYHLVTIKWMKTKAPNIFKELWFEKGLRSRLSNICLLWFIGRMVTKTVYYNRWEWNYELKKEVKKLLNWETFSSCF